MNEILYHLKYIFYLFVSFSDNFAVSKIQLKAKPITKLKTKNQ